MSSFPCSSCGADLEFKPGTEHLECPYCGTLNHIEVLQEEIEELDYRTFLQEATDVEGATEERLTVNCGTCGGVTCLGENVTADKCEFCGSRIVAQAKSIKAIKPRSLLPFKVTRQQATESFRSWIKGLWFAPNALKKLAKIHEGIQGVYCPFWTYDCETTTRYQGQRGEYYYEDQTYTATEDGRQVTKTRRVKKTRWYPASGTVQVTFDDVLVLGTRSLPEKHTDELEPWNLEDLVPYNDQYLSGFKVQSYNVNLEEGFGEAQKKMDPVIRESIHHDIGGDTQRISSMDVSWYDITFKHVLLPVWISAYRYNGTVYRFLVNARTGEVQGERPWSWPKIAFTVLTVLAFIMFFVYGR